MNKIDLLKMAASNLWRRKLRTALTILGVIIGTASIVVMMSLGFGMRQSQEEMFSQFGDVTVIEVYPGMDNMPGGGSMGARSNKLDKNALQDFKNLPNVLAVTPILSSYGSLKTGRYEASANILGIDSSGMADFEYKTMEGRLLNRNDKMTHSIPVVIGGEVQHQFYNPKSRSNREPNINLMTDKLELSLEGNYDPDANSQKTTSYTLEVVGILEGDDYETSSSLFMSYEDLEKINSEQEESSQGNQRKSSKKEYNNLKIKASSRDHVVDIQNSIKEMGYEAYSMQETLETFESSTMIMQAVLGGIGSISLLVAAIGITNTMIMSIYERTREIGIMKVIGALIKDIKSLFLVEAAYIGFLGGFLGLILSYLISYFLNKFSGVIGEALSSGMGTKISIIPPYLAIAAVVFSVGIGLLAGYFPAQRAMNLSALEAIKSE